MSLKKILSDIRENTYCRLQVSPVHGVGVFAIKNIRKGTDPFKDAPDESKIVYKVKHEELKNLEGDLRRYVYDMYISDLDFIYLENLTPNNLPIYYRMNHSNEPNIKWEKKSYCFVALKKIEKGQELLIDYGKY